MDVYKNLDLSKIEDEIRLGRFKNNSLVGQSWVLFEDLIKNLVEDQVWMNNYQQASSRPRLIYNRNSKEDYF